MRTFKKGQTIWKSADEITIKALISSGYEEIVETVEAEPETEPVMAKPKKRSRIEE
jgi:hypothetical protein